MVKKFTIPFASQGDANDIPDALQVDGKVSFTQGFGYDYERPYDDPQAKDIAREDMNGLFKAITSAVGELQTLGASEWSSAIAYPKGAIVYFEKDLYISQVDDNQNKPPQSWVSITNIANDSLKKAANLSDLTNKATARNNLGLGSSATLNKTDTLGTSSSLVATQKLVNDTKINLESSKQDKLEFIGVGKVMREGAYGIGAVGITPPLPGLINHFYTVQEGSGETEGFDYYYGVKVTHTHPGYFAYIGVGHGHGDTAILQYSNGNARKYKLYNELNTSTDKSGFLRASGNANALTEVDAIPIGTIQAFVGENAPNDKWLLCRGQAFSASNYPELAKLLPGLKIPDLRGVALRGLDANRGFDPNRALLSYQEDAMQRIYGEWAPGSEKSVSSAGKGVVSMSKYIGKAVYSKHEDGKEVVHFIFDSSLSTRTARETIMKNVAVNFIIKAR